MGAALAKVFFKKGQDVLKTEYASLGEIMVTTLEG